MSKKKIRKEIESDQNPFALSTGDMMSGLMFVFVLLLSALMLQIQKQSERTKRQIEDYNQIKREIYIDLKKEFGKDTLRWNAKIDSAKLSIRFEKTSTLFDTGESDLKADLKEILDDFFPRYMLLITKDQYRASIEEIRIEGYADSRGKYEKNMELSQARARTILNYCIQKAMPDTVVDNETTMETWAKSKLTANGHSSSHLIYENGQENFDLSRRVEFRVRTNAESKMEEILDSLQLKD
ncbi:OmpA family protein [Candidatus Saccharibacteria bacterium]|nr:OmpA family protein [Candidatus Saccharibacteria bacterium]